MSMSDSGMEKSDRDHGHDEIVQELDVYLSPELASCLYYLHFPTRYEPLSATAAESVDVKFKPKCQVLELGVPVPTMQNAHYCQEKGRAFAAPALSRGEKSNEPQAPLLNRQLWSAQVMPSSAHYMMGTIHDGKLFLTPIKAVLQMRLSMNYLLSDTGARPAAMTGQRTQAKDARMEDEAPVAKTVQMQFRKRETEEELQSRIKSFTWQQKLVNEEHWLPLRYHDPESEASRLTFLSIFQKTKQEAWQ